jgi:hypothetical protein
VIGTDSKMSGKSHPLCELNLPADKKEAMVVAERLLAHHTEKSLLGLIFTKSTRRETIRDVLFCVLLRIVSKRISVPDDVKGLSACIGRCVKKTARSLVLVFLYDTLWEMASLAHKQETGVTGGGTVTALIDVDSFTLTTITPLGVVEVKILFDTRLIHDSMQYFFADRVELIGCALAVWKTLFPASKIEIKLESETILFGLGKIPLEEHFCVLGNLLFHSRFVGDGLSEENKAVVNLRFRSAKTIEFIDMAEQLVMNASLDGKPTLFNVIIGKEGFRNVYQPVVHVPGDHYGYHIDRRGGALKFGPSPEWTVTIGVLTLKIRYCEQPLPEELRFQCSVGIISRMLYHVLSAQQCSRPFLDVVWLGNPPVFVEEDCEEHMRLVAEVELIDRMTALAMGLHPRLGGEPGCAVSMIAPEVLRVVCDFAMCPRMVGQLRVKGEAWSKSKLSRVISGSVAQ